MKTLLVLLALCGAAIAQNTNAPSIVSFAGDPTGKACGPNMIGVNASNGNTCGCSAGVYAACGGSGGSGITSITAGAGLSGGTITTTGTIAVVAASGSLPNCSAVSAGLPSWGVCVVPTSVLTAAAFAASNNTTAQIDVIPAQGSNRVVDVIDAICEKTAGTAFGTGAAGNLTIGYDNGNNTSTDISNVQGFGFLDQTAIIDASLGGTGTSVLVAQIVQNLGNLAVSVYNSSGAITAGSPIYCTFNYRIHTNQ